MAQFAPVVLLDGQATPVSHTFSPVKINAVGLAIWNDRSGGIPIGYPVLTKLVKEPAPKGAQVFKVSMKIALPTLEVSSPATSTGFQPAPTVAYTHYATVEFSLPARGTKLNRQDLLAYVKNALANANFAASVLDFDADF